MCVYLHSSDSLNLLDTRTHGHVTDTSYRTRHKLMSNIAPERSFVAHVWHCFFYTKFRIRVKCKRIFYGLIKYDNIQSVCMLFACGSLVTIY